MGSAELWDTWPDVEKFKNRTSNSPQKNSSGFRRVTYLEENSGEGSYGGNTDKIVVTVGGFGEAPFDMMSRINNNYFRAMIASGSPLTIFTTTDLEDLLRTDVSVARPLLQSEK